ncbi:MAG TPA: TonB-dependent receptor [Gemmatimonadaceae bacterium]|nr:TonB-dependent receptor [Gemmatimonadaceae bacterium]
MSLALVLAILHASGVASLEGSVRSSDASAPVVAALIEITSAAAPDSAIRVLTDSAGRYALPGLPSGTYHLRVSRIGFDPRELDVLLNTAPRVVVDIVLVPRPERLSELRVNAAFAGDSATLRRTTSLAPNGFDSTVLSGDMLHADPALASADALQSLASRGLAGARDEAPTSLHVLGGGASENGISIDGVPVFNPYHSTGALTALNPDVISSVSLARGAPSAAFGDATAGAIGLVTMPADTTRIETRGAFGARSLREEMSGPLTIRNGTFLVALRRSLDASLSDSPSGSIGGAEFGDLFAKFTVPTRGGELEAFAFHSKDRLSFDATPEADSPITGARAESRRENDLEDAQAPQQMMNALGWSTGTDALRWHSDGATRWELRAWRTRFDADFSWAGASRLTNSLEDLGAAASASWMWGGAHVQSGVSADRYDVRYDVTNTTAGAGAPLALANTPMLLSAFGEAQWSVGERWAFAAGVRDALVAPARAGLEPRLSARFSPGSALSFGLSYARLHQYVQSLRNEESLFDAIAGISLPAIAGSTFNGEVVPAAQADQLTATADARLSRSLTLRATAYARDVSGLVLVAPVTAQPFATTAFDVGSARANGLSVSLARDGERVTSELGYSLSSVTQRAGGLSYTPSYGTAQSAMAAVGVRVEPSTVLRVAVAVHGGAPTSLYADPIEWTPYTSSAGQGDLAGSPQRIVGALDGARLPAYVRFDVGVRHDWRLRLFGRESGLTTSVGLTNLFNRGNALGMLAAPAGSSALLLLPRRSATFGLEWKY